MPPADESRADPPVDPDTTTSTRGEQTRRSILDAAIARFGRDGYRSTSVADIARDAGVGGTLTYAYFPNKEALFLAALDEDAAGVIDEGVSSMLEGAAPEEWRETLILTLVDAVERHPLARRVLAGLEPHVTARMLDIPAMTELRKAVAERLRSDQAAGTVRSDIDAVAVGNGAVVIVISILMSVLQFGREGVAAYGPDVLAVFAATFDPVDHPAGPTPPA
jgi:AcrR family transcriptional regulator